MKFFLQILIMLTAAIPAALAHDNAAQNFDANHVSPHLYKALYENDRVKITLFSIEPGAKEAMHIHPNSTYYVLEAGKIKIDYADGTGKVADMVKGLTFYLDATHKHKVENIGTTTLKVICTELKAVSKIDK